MLLNIEKLIYGGDGLARVSEEDGRKKAVFVPFVLEGEEVEARIVETKRNFARAAVEEIVLPSSERVVPGCCYFERCGGCHYQHTGYEHQLAVKAAILKENLQRIARQELDTELQIHASPPWNYRNRSRLKVVTEPEFALGYYKFNSHQLLPVEQCPISSPLINRAISACWQLGPTSFHGVSEIQFFVNEDDTRLLIELSCARETTKVEAQKAADHLQAAIPHAVGVAAFASGRESTANDGPATDRPTRIGPAVTRDDGPLATAGNAHLDYHVAGQNYRVSAGAFFQVNRHMTQQLLQIVTENESGKTALDLYAGVGLFTCALAKQFEKVVAVESLPISHSDLRYNAPENVKAVRSMAEQYLKNVAGKAQPDLVVLDPPRSGLGESVIHSLVRLGVPRVTYVSCDPATLSRDLSHLKAAGYAVRRAHLVDLFPQTYHLESVFHLVR
ncbi:MAG: class I SAM-dependent RNA methyltransferase [Acidobacteriales bacterium]|nr:class I SAM-dependent RNA methyltransferase [Terriglobales bacterium]